MLKALFFIGLSKLYCLSAFVCFCRCICTIDFLVLWCIFFVIQGWQYGYNQRTQAKRWCSKDGIIRYRALICINKSNTKFIESKELATKHLLKNDKTNLKSTLHYCKNRSKSLWALASLGF